MFSLSLFPDNESARRNQNCLIPLIGIAKLECDKINRSISYHLLHSLAIYDLRYMPRITLPISLIAVL